MTLEVVLARELVIAPRTNKQFLPVRVMRLHVRLHVALPRGL